MGGRNPWPDVPRNQRNGRFKSRGGCLVFLLLSPVVFVVYLLMR
jgi:hypothetical protein